MTRSEFPPQLLQVSWRRGVAAVMAMLIGTATLAVVGAGSAQADPTLLHSGQVFASIGNSDVNVYDAGSGNLVTTLNDGTYEPYTTGGAFDSKGNFYVTDDFNGDISEYDNQGNLLPLFAGGLTNPESLTFDNSGNLYVGQQTTPYVAEFDPNGNRLDDIGPMNTELYGVDWIDLASDQCTLYYTTEGTDIMRYDKCTNTQLPNFNVASFDPNESAFEMRIQPDGGVLVADSDAVLRLDANGNVVQTYSCNDLPGCNGQLFALDLDPDGTSFWTGDSYSGIVWQVDIATGQVLQTINTGSGLLYGLTVDGELTVATSPGGGSSDVPTTLSVNPATSDYSVPTTVSGVLTNSNTSAPIAGEPVAFSLNGDETCTGTTDSTGTASCSITPGEAQGTYPLTATFGGDTTQSPSLLSSNGASTFVVTPDPTTTTYTGTTATTNGQPAVLSGVLKSFGSPLPGKTVLLTLGSGSSVQSCNGITNSSGSASCTIASVNQTVGSVPVTASFAGDDYYVASSDSSTASVDTDTKLKVNAATGDYNVATTVTGVLTNLNTSAAIAGEPVTFTLNGAESCSGITDGTGTVSCPITPGEAQGSYPLTATFGGDTSASPVLLASNGSNTFVVTPDPTAITYTGATSATNGASATLSGTLSVFGNPLPGKAVTLTLGSGPSAQSCAALTSVTGSASCSIASVDQSVGSVPVSASFAGDNYYLSSTVSSNVTVSPPPPVPTTLTVHPATGDFNVTTAVSATLTTTATSSPVVGEPVTLSVNGSELCIGITDSTGVATCTLTPGEAKGTYPLTGTFAGDATQTPNLLGSTGASTFVVTPDPTTITYTGATAATIGQPATLSGVLSAFGNPVPNRPVTLTLGSGGSAQSCAATTNASGSASCAIASVDQSVGPVPVAAAFAGDDYYSPSSVTAIVTVSAPAAIPTTLSVSAATGDYNVATPVSAVLTNANTSAPISGEPVTLTLNATETCTAVTDATGTATCSLAPGEAKGTYPLIGTFGGDATPVPALLASAGSNTFVVTPDPTAITYTGDTSATNGASATLSGTLSAFGIALPGKPVTLTLGSGGTAQSCGATTNATGSASCSIASVDQSVGSVPVAATFAGDNYYLASTDTSNVTVSPPPPVPTTLTVHPATGDFNVTTAVSATLTTTATSSPVVGEPVTLALNGTETCVAITDGTGVATCTLTPGEASGSYPLSATFTGDTSASPILLGSVGASTFVVTPDPTTITYTGATAATIGQPATLSGVLSAFGNPVPNRPVTLTLGSGGSAQSCAATTNASGSASCAIASVDQSVGPVPVAAAFAGDDYYSPSSVTAIVTVSAPAAIPTTLSVSAATGDYNVATPVSAVLTNANTSAPISGEPVTLTLNATETCTAVTDATGTATCSLAPGEAKGTYPLIGTFGGDATPVPALLASAGSNTFVVTPDPTAITYTGDTSATNGASATLSGTLSAFGIALPGKPVTLTLGSGGTAQSCGATTNATGSASCSIASVDQSVGSVPVAATFGGDNYYLASTDTSNVTVSPPPPVPTTLTVHPATGDYNVTTAVSATLTTTATSSPVVGEPVTLTLNGSETCVAITDGTGVATCTLTPGEAKGSYPLVATFTGDTSLSPVLLASTGTSTFVVTPDPTAITYTGDTAANNGQPATLSGVLTSFGAPLPGKPVTLTLGSGGSAQSCGATTDATGSASCAISSVAQSVGSVPVAASFAGDDYYQAATATSNVTVSPPLAIPTTLSVSAATGDYNVATPVSAVLTNANTSAPISGEPVTLTLNGTEACTGTTDATGTATCSITPGEAKGSYPLTGVFTGDTSVTPNLLGSTGSSTFVVTPDPTAITYTGATSVVNGSAATLSGTLSVFGHPLASKPVTLTLGTGGSAQTCSATTDSTGSAACAIASVNQSAGSVPASASFAGDDYYLASNASITVGVGTPTTLAVHAASGEYNVATPVSATLSNSVSTAPIAGEPVTLTLNGSENCTAITDGTGTATCSVTPGEAKGTYPLGATFGGDTTVAPVLLGSSGTSTFVVSPDPTAITYTGDTVATNGSSATLSGTLSVFGAPLSSKTVTFTLGTGASAQTCHATTNASGAASCTISSVAQANGSVPVSAAFAGDNYYAASSDASALTVSAPPIPTTLSVHSATGDYNVATTVTGVLTNTATSAPIANEAVTLTLNGTEACTGTTDATGTATCSITPGEAQGSYPLAGTFGGDPSAAPALLASAGSNTFVVTPDPTATIYTGATSANNGSAATLSGMLSAFGNPLASKPVTLTLGTGGSAQSCSATTNASGSASCAISSVAQAVGPVPVSAAFAGDNYYLASSATAIVTVSPPPPVPTTLAVNAASSQYNVATTVSGTLSVTATSAPVAGESVTFKLNGSETCSATTDASGAASCAITPGETPASYPLTATFGGDTGVVPNLLASGGTNTFVVTPDPTAIVYTGATTATNGSSATLSGTLSVFGNPLSSKTVTLTLGSGGTAQSCAATTNASGSASCAIASVSQSVGVVPVTAAFAGTAYYLASSTSASVTVSPSPQATTLTVNAATGNFNVATTISGTLSVTATAAPVANEPVTLKLNASESCTGTTNSSGTASCTVTPGEAKGTYPLTGTFGGDAGVSPVLLASAGSSTFVVTPDPTAIVYTGATTATNGSAATLSGTLSVFGNPLASKPVTLTLGSGGTAQSCVATTNAAGSASCAIASVAQAIGLVPVSATFAGDNYYAGSTVSSNVTVSLPPPVPTTLAVSSATGQYNVSTTVSGTLTITATSAPVAGETVTLKLNGSETCSATTNSAGKASCAITPGEAQGTYPLIGTFGGDTVLQPNLLASTGTNSFVVTPDPTATVYTGTTTATNGQPATLSGTLTAFGSAVPGKTVTFTLGSGSTAQSCTGTTNGSGSASCAIAAVLQTDGPVPVTAAFAGDNYYLASSASSSVTVTDQVASSCLAGGENNLYSVSPSMGTPVSAGQTVSAVYTDESPLGNGTLNVGGQGNQTGGPAPAVFLAGVQLPASALSITGVASSPKDNQADATLSFTVPAGTPTGSTVEILFFDSDWSTSNWTPGTNPEIFPSSASGTNGCGEAVWNSHTPMPTGSITGHIYKCTTSGTPIVPATEVLGGDIAATGTGSGTTSVSADDNPISFSVSPGTYSAAATAPPGYTLVPCGGTSKVAAGGASATVSNLTVTLGGTTNVVFYAEAVPLAPLPTTLKLSGASGQYGTATTVSAVLTSGGGPGQPPAAPASNETVTFTLNGHETCTDTTDSTGTASCPITPGEVPANNYTLTASFAGDTTVYPAMSASSASEPFNVTAAPTALAYTGTTTAVNGGSATLSGTLTSNGTPVAGQTVSFTIGGGATVQTCTGTTNTSGAASCTIASVNQTAGSVPINANFAATADYTASKSPGVNLTVGVLTNLKVTATTGAYGSATTVSALLTNANTSAAITNESVTLTLNGTETCTAVTNNTGTATCTITPGESAGTYSLSGSFAGDTTKPAVLYASSGAANFVVTPAVTNLTYGGSTAVVNGGSATLSSVLTSGGASLAGDPVLMTLGSGATAQSCTGTTTSTGTASCVISPVSQSIGSVPVSSSFAGNSYFQSATASANVNVYLTAPPPAGITFVNAKKGAGAATTSCTATIPSGVPDVNTFPNAICSTDGNAGNTVSFDVELASGGTPTAPTALTAVTPVTVTTTYTQTGGATFTSAASQTISPGTSATVTPFSVSIVGGSFIQVTCSVTVGSTTVTLKMQVH